MLQINYLPILIGAITNLQPMLRFFRKLRHRLLTENRFNKYLLYAVGEILLVVIGILIALQVDNWNEGRKDVRTEMDYWVSLYAELNRNLEQVNFQIGVNQRQTANARFILSVMDGDTVLKSSKPLALALQEVPWYVPINITRNVWTELIATGNVSLLNQEEIKQGIARFYSDIDRHLELEKECQTYYMGFRQTVAPLLGASDWVALTEYLQNNEGNNMDLSAQAAYKRSGSSLKLELPQPDKLRDDLIDLHILNGFLADLISCREFGKRTFLTYRNDLESIIKSIDSVLKRSS